MRKSLIIIFILISTLIVVSTGCTTDGSTSTEETGDSTSTEEPVEPVEPVKTFTLANDYSATMPIGIGLDLFAEELAKLSNGTIVIDVHHDGTLGDEAGVVEGIQLGTIQLGKVNTGNFAAFVNEYNAFTIPYIFRSQEHAWNVFDGPVGDKMKSAAEEEGFKVLAFLEEGARHIYSRDKFIETPDDMTGLKIRIMAAETIQDGFKALGTSPTPMAFGEIFTGLQQGVVDAAESSLVTIHMMKFHEVAPYITMTGHLRTPGVLIMSMEKWNSLSTEEQEMFQDAADTASIAIIEEFNKMEKEFHDKIIEEGAQIKELSAEEVLEFEKASQPVIEKYNDIIGSNIVQDIVDTQ